MVDEEVFETEEDELTEDEKYEEDNEEELEDKKKSNEPSEFERIIKQYLDKEAFEDEYFKEKYDSSKINKCCEYIIKQAQKNKTTKQCAVIEDNVVFKWARDFYNEGLDKKEEKKSNVPQAKVVVKKEVKVEKDNQLNIFDFGV